jgi:hypothetical protein
MVTAPGRQRAILRCRTYGSALGLELNGSAQLLKTQDGKYCDDGKQNTNR